MKSDLKNAKAFRDAVDLFLAKYIVAVSNPEYVYDPICYALYYTWKELDEARQKKLDKATKSDKSIPLKPARDGNKKLLCQNCSKQILGKYAYCPYCGRRLKEYKESELND